MAESSQKMISAKGLREKLSSWDQNFNPKAPLSDIQKDGFMELTTLSANRPLPTELSQEDFPAVVSRVSHDVSNTTANSETDDLTKQFSNLGHEKIENAQQFFTWYSEVEEEMERDEELQQRQLMEQLQTYRSDCDNVLGEVNQALSHLDHLRERYVAVSTKTNALHEACEHLLAEQTKLVNTAESINNKLAYFNELERISSKLGSPTLTVTSESFVPMLSRLDECIAYLNQNPQYKESSVYMVKFKSCLARALSLIKTHVINILQNATQNVMPKKVDEVYKIADEKKDVVSVVDDAFTLFYGKFRTNAPRVKALMEQIEQRVDKSPEYQQLLNDCHQCYFNQRLTLLGPSVSTAVAELASKHVRDHCALMRSGCAFMVHVCEDEHQLFYHFFSKHTPVLEATLESLCNNLYDVFRPLIIHINHLETLAELCSILKVEMIEEHVYNNPQPLVAFETVCSQMLEDVQERLVYRTHIYIRSEILNYNPAQGDLAYPEKLQMMENIAASIKEQNDIKLHSRNSPTASATSIEVANIDSKAGGEDTVEKPDENKNINGKVSTGVGEHGFVSVPLVSEGTAVGGGNMPMSPADLHGMWYPTVRRTLVCLSKLYRCIDKTTFQGLSQETLSMCIQSLVKASDIIAKNKSGMDGQLFLVKHLLILREQIAPFHVDFAVKETALDFSKIKEVWYDVSIPEAAVGLYAKRKKLFAFNSNNAILQFLLEGTPSVTETFIDSKKEVDNQLKKTCEDFIALVTNMLIGPLKMFLDKSSVILEMKKEEAGAKVSLRQQPFASPENLQNVVAQSWKTLKANKSKVQESMALYLANKDTEYILLKPVKGNVIQNFQQLQEMMANEYSVEDQQIIGCPSLEQINLLLSSLPTKS